MPPTDLEIIVDLARKVAGADTLEEAAPALRGMGDAMDAGRVSFVADYACGSAVHRDVIVRLFPFFDWNVKTMRSWRDRALYLSSPIGARCRTGTAPFLWDAEELLSQHPARGEAQRGQWQFALEHGVVAGITAPVHLPLGRVASVSWMTTSAAHRLGDIVVGYGALLAMAAQSFICAVLRADAAHKEVAPALRTQFDEAGDLTPLELECLQWIALGKTDDEIAEIIGRSRAAVRFRLKSSMTKLGTTSRAQAVAVCSQLGLLRPLLRA